MSVKVRFAPSPTGRLHVGNIRSALINFLLARQAGGVFIHRSDDTDKARSTLAFEQGIKEDLDWLGIAPDTFFRQSDRFGDYDAAAAWLKAEGMLYPCYETAEELDRKRKLQRARGLPPVYDRAALMLAPEMRRKLETEGRKPHWRLKLSRATVAWTDLIRGDVSVDTSSVSDPVLIRADGQYLYTLPSCVDDVDHEISHVIRGEDHVTNTATQIELFHHLIRWRGAGQLPLFAHHSLMVGADGAGLSKRVNSLSIEALRAAGFEAAAITSLLSKIGTSDPVTPQAGLEPLIETFSFEKMSRAPARFDETELLALNAKILQSQPFEAVRNRLEPLNVGPELWALVQGNIEKLEDACAWRDIIYGEITPDIEDRPYTDEAAALVPDLLDRDSWQVLTAQLREKTDRKGRALFMPLRKALTGQAHGPDMAGIYQLIGAERARARLRGERA